MTIFSLDPRIRADERGRRMGRLLTSILRLTIILSFFRCGVTLS